MTRAGRERTYYKYGSDVQIGDMLRCGAGGFMVLGFAVYDPPTGGAGRLALNNWGDGMVLFDDHQVGLIGVSQSNGRSGLDNKCAPEGVGSTARDDLQSIPNQPEGVPL